MSVAARVVHWPFVATTLALLKMTSESRRSAVLDGSERLSVNAGQLGMGVQVRVGVSTEDVAHGEPRSHRHLVR